MVSTSSITLLSAIFLRVLVISCWIVLRKCALIYNLTGLIFSASLRGIFSFIFILNDSESSLLLYFSLEIPLLIPLFYLLLIAVVMGLTFAYELDFWNTSIILMLFLSVVEVWWRFLCLWRNIFFILLNDYNRKAALRIWGEWKV